VSKTGTFRGHTHTDLAIVVDARSIPLR
jgi:hypothetical protein